MNKENIPLNSQLGKNYIIQQLFSKQVQLSNTTHEPYTYDFDDFWGEKDWSNMFVSKLLKTGTGQCHSMPLLYLILAEETNTQAWLSLAPEHSFIIFQSDNGLTNFETTNGHLATDDWLLESGFIDALAIKNKIYLDTLGHDGVFSTLLADLAMGYVVKFGYDDFTRSMVDKLLDIYPQSIQGHILKADILTLDAQRAIKEAGNPPPEQLNRHPNAYQAIANLKKQYALIDSLGYRHMPKEDYAAWRASGDSSTTNQTKNE